MITKLMNIGSRSRTLLARMRHLSQVPVRQAGHLIPPDQYDSVNIRLYPRHALVHNWEVIPLFATTGISLTMLAFAILWSVRNKVDVVFKTHSRDCISRTMDLRCPTVHKLITINQVYEPWPLMQEVREKCDRKEMVLKQLACACIKDKARKHKGA